MGNGANPSMNGMGSFAGVQTKPVSYARKFQDSIRGMGSEGAGGITGDAQNGNLFGNFHRGADPATLGSQVGQGPAVPAGGLNFMMNGQGPQSLADRVGGRPDLASQVVGGGPAGGGHPVQMMQRQKRQAMGGGGRNVMKTMQGMGGMNLNGVPNNRLNMM